MTADRAADPRPQMHLPGRQVTLTMAAAVAALFLASLGQIIVATALPGIVADLGGFDSYTWVATGYVLASSIAIPISGRLGDIHGRKLVFVLGIAVFLVASAACGVSLTMSQLAAARALQGIGGGVMMTVGFVAVADLFPPEERGKQHGLNSLVFGAAALIGPLLGAYLTENASWRWIFFLNLPLGLPVLLLIARVYPKIESQAERRSTDYLGMAALALAVAPILLALTWAGVHYEWGSPQIIGLLSFGTAMAVGLVLVESKAESPIMPLGIYGDRVVAASLVMVFLAGAAFYASVVFVPLLFQAGLGVSATGSGAYLTAMVLSMVVAMVLSGRFLSKPNPRYRFLGVAATGLMAVGMYLIATVDRDANVIRAVASVVVVGAGVGGVLTAVLLAVQNSVPFEHVGIATSAVQFYRQVGGMLGLAVLGASVTVRFSAKMEAAVRDAARDDSYIQQLEAIREDPAVLLDRAEVAALGMPDALLNALRSALAGAVGDTMAVCAAAVALSAAAALFLDSSPGTHTGARRPARSRRMGRRLP